MKSATAAALPVTSMPSGTSLEVLSNTVHLISTEEPLTSVLAA